MNVTTLLEMAATAHPDRIAIGPRSGGMTYAQLMERASAGAARLRAAGAPGLVYLAGSGPAFAMALFASAWAGVPLIPLNYRLGAGTLAELAGRHPGALLVSETQPGSTLAGVSVAEWLATQALPGGPDSCGRWSDDDSVALTLYTSGTSAQPKAALLRHGNLSSYLLGSVEFDSAGPDAAGLVSVPPYHIAGVANLLSSIYSGRRLVYLDTFSPEHWLECVRTQDITHTLVVPTMLARITEHLRDRPAPAVPSLRSLAYGGAKMPAPVLERALRLFPDVDFVNAYGLTETSSTVAVLGPDDHRAALHGDDAARARLGSVGRLVPGIEAQVRADDGTPLPPGSKGEVFLRGPQVSGEYYGQGNVLDREGWFPTRDSGWVDADGYLFIEGRADDTIIRGGENIAPAEIEDALLTHDAVASVAVVGVPDEEWGQQIAAAVVLRSGRTATADELREHVRDLLRTSRTPARIVFLAALPETPTGKVLRRQVLADVLVGETGAAG